MEVSGWYREELRYFVVQASNNSSLRPFQAAYYVMVAISPFWTISSVKSQVTLQTPLCLCTERVFGHIQDFRNNENGDLNLLTSLTENGWLGLTAHTIKMVYAQLNVIHGGEDKSLYVICYADWNQLLLPTVREDLSFTKGLRYYENKSSMPEWIDLVSK